MPWKALLTGDLSHWRTRPKTFTVNFPASDRIERHEVVAEVSIDIGDADVTLMPHASIKYVK